MEEHFLTNLQNLTMTQKTSLSRGNMQKISDLLLDLPENLARKCRISLREMETIINLVCNELYQKPCTLREVAHIGEEKFTTGDPHIDKALGGGIRTGMIWEIVGENNAGKTQLALQLCLSVQLPQRLGGVSGAACYITTRETLQTERLSQVMNAHPVLSSEYCDFSDIQTVKALTFDVFSRVINETITAFAIQRMNTDYAKPVKLLVIDTLTDFFDWNKNLEYAGDLRKRANDLRKTSLLLQRLATKYRLAVVMLGSTRDSSYVHADDRESLGIGEILYSDQARWFSRAHSLPGEDKHEAAMGHAWPNQLNARIMMTRTDRTRPRYKVDPQVRDPDTERAIKRRRLDSGHPASQPSDDEPVAYRRFSVVFSSVAPVCSCDYVILEKGVVGFPTEQALPSTYMFAAPIPTQQSSVFPKAAPTSSPTSGNDGSLQRYSQSIPYVSNLSPQEPTPPPLAYGTSQSGVNAEADDDKVAYWRHTQDITNDETLAGVTDGHVEEAADDGPPKTPPADGAGSDSDFYWND